MCHHVSMLPPFAFTRSRFHARMRPKKLRSNNSRSAYLAMQWHRKDRTKRKNGKKERKSERKPTPINTRKGHTQPKIVVHRYFTVLKRRVSLPTQAGYMCVCVRVCVCVFFFVFVLVVCVRARACVCFCVRVHPLPPLLQCVCAFAVVSSLEAVIGSGSIV